MLLCPTTCRSHHLHGPWNLDKHMRDCWESQPQCKALTWIIYVFIDCTSRLCMETRILTPMSPSFLKHSRYPPCSRKLSTIDIGSWRLTLMWSSNSSCCCRKRSTPLSKLKTAEGPQQKSRVLIWSIGVLCTIEERLPVSCHLPLSLDLWHNHHRYVLEQILLGEPTEVVVESIHEYLTSISEQVQNGTTKLEDFNVFKVSKLSRSSWREFLNTATHQCLRKNPKDYPDVKMKQQGGSAHVGDVIPYMFCLAEGEETAKTAQANWAKHPDEVWRAGLELRVSGQPLFSSIPAVYWRELDYKHYLLQQLLPPIERMCDPIEGTLVPTLFTFLLCIDTEFDASHSTGLDPQCYKTSNGPEERTSLCWTCWSPIRNNYRTPFPLLFGVGIVVSTYPLHLSLKEV